MARNTKPLNILVSKSLASVAQIQVLADKGHTLVIMGDQVSDPDDFDMIFSPKAWRMTEELATSPKQAIDIAVTASRAVKFRRKKKGEEDDDET